MKQSIYTCEGTFVYADQSQFNNIRHLLEEGKTYTRNVVNPEMIKYVTYHNIYPLAAYH